MFVFRTFDVKRNAAAFNNLYSRPEEKKPETGAKTPANGLNSCRKELPNDANEIERGAFSRHIGSYSVAATHPALN